MLINGFAVNEDIIQINKNSLVKEWEEDLIHDSLERARSIAKPKGHYKPLVCPIATCKGCLFLVLGGHANLVVTISKIQF